MMSPRRCSQTRTRSSQSWSMTLGLRRLTSESSRRLQRASAKHTDERIYDCICSAHLSGAALWRSWWPAGERASMDASRREWLCGTWGDRGGSERTGNRGRCKILPGAVVVRAAAVTCITPTMRIGTWIPDDVWFHLRELRPAQAGDGPHDLDATIFVEMLGLERGTSVEAQDRARLGSVLAAGLISQHFEPNTQVEQC